MFSIASSPAERDRLSITYAVKGAFTTRMERELTPGGSAWVKLPYGEFVVDPDRDAVLFAGGTGITAFTAFLQSLTPDRAARVVLFYGARTFDLFVYGPLARARAREVPSLACHLVCEATHGRLDVAAAWPEIVTFDNPLFYLSGPPAMLAALAAQLRDAASRRRTSGPMPGSNARPLPERDLDHVLEHSQGLWEDLRGGRLFVTGGTGFFGRWMLESFLRANDELGLKAEAILLTRDPGRFADAAPHVAGHAAIRLHTGDVHTFDQPNEACSHVLHMATETVLGRSAAASFQTAVEGTQRVLDFSARRGVRRLLLTSSGAIYGRQPPEIERLSEEYAGAPSPDDASAGYAHGKRAAEFLCAVAAAETGLQATIARCFAFVGPLLPLDANFAVGNFIRDALDGDHIEVDGDGTPRRSYLYAADLAVWLWTILFMGEPGRPYNVGSEADLSISELADLVTRVLAPGLPVHVAKAPTEGALPARYIPSTSRAIEELDLEQHVSLDEAVLRTALWYSAGPTPRPRG